MMAGTRARRAVFILGMHRSGTSCLAGCLGKCGLAFGPPSRIRPDNRKGHLENPRIWKLQNDLLRLSGGSWFEPPERVTWTDEHRRRRDDILEAYLEYPVFGIKDPRTLLTLDFWRESALHISCVASFRHPLAVAESLRARNAIPIREGLNLWTTYNRCLVRWREELEFDLVNFDLPAHEYLSSVSHTARGLGLDPPRDPAGFTFFEPTLRHDAPSESPLSSEIVAIYRDLEGLADRGRRS